MNTKTKSIVGAVVIAAVFFYGGYAYASGKSPSQARLAYAGGIGGFTRGAGGMMGGRNGGGVVAGSIIAADSQSITVGEPGNGSKIVFVGGSTQVMKTVLGSLSDLAVGMNVVVTGTPNSDGSITGTTVQIRPVRPATTTSATPSSAQ